MHITEITDINDEKVRVFSSLTERQLCRHPSSELGLFIAESPKVINVAIANGYEPQAMLCERKHISGDAAGIIGRFPEMPVYTGERSVLAGLCGYTLTRGVLCAMARKPLPRVEDVARGASRVCVISGVCDTTNIGAIFRSASALGIDGIILSEDSCDPLNRRSIRVSMGTVFTIPWTFSADPCDALHALDFKVASLALRHDNIALDDPVLKSEERLAVVFGTEGEGLAADVLDKSDYVIKIPMHHGVDSLNVAAAAAVAFWELRTGDRAPE